jgi:hypothetical protein
VSVGVWCGRECGLLLRESHDDGQGKGKSK